MKTTKTGKSQMRTHFFLKTKSFKVLVIIIFNLSGLMNSKNALIENRRQFSNSNAEKEETISEHRS